MVHIYDIQNMQLLAVLILEINTPMDKSYFVYCKHFYGDNQLYRMHVMDTAK